MLRDIAQVVISVIALLGGIAMIVLGAVLPNATLLALGGTTTGGIVAFWITPPPALANLKNPSP